MVLFNLILNKLILKMQSNTQPSQVFNPIVLFIFQDLSFLFLTCFEVLHNLGQLIDSLLLIKFHPYQRVLGVRLADAFILVDLVCFFVKTIDHGLVQCLSKFICFFVVFRNS